jgi:hypothetical protein
VEELTGGYGDGPLPDNMAEKILGLYTQEKPKPQPGRPIAIDDGRLLGARDHLVWLFEVTWADVGERVPWIKKPSDVLDAIRVWDNPNLSTGNHYIAKCLLRPSSIPVTQKWLNARRFELGKLNSAVREVYEAREKCREALEKAERALSDQLSDSDKAAVLDQISRRGEKLSGAKAEYDSLEKQQRELQELVLDGEASFAREEFARFCGSNRYRFEPMNIANALAGLPYIGWRQSATRCKKHPSTHGEGQSIQIFRTIERIVRSCVRRSDLAGHAEKYLRDKKIKKSLGVSELRKKWYYLRWSIKTVLDADPRVSTRNLPFAITREYWRRTSRPSNVDALFEEEERIVI